MLKSFGAVRFGRLPLGLIARFASGSGYGSYGGGGGGRHYDDDDDFVSRSGRQGSFGGGRGGGYDGGGRGGYGGGGRSNFSGSYGRHDRFGSRGGGPSNFAGQNLRPVNWGDANLEPPTKDLYREHASVTQRSQSDIDMWLKENEVTLNGKNVMRPIFEFAETTFPEQIQGLLHSKRFTRPTTIQSISWPLALSGRDIISIAKTGSGKTLGFILPAIVHTVNQAPRTQGEGPTVLVLLPTRELAQQVEEVARDYCRMMKLSTVCCYGGASKFGQSDALQRGVDICIATPGRLLDFLESGATNMRRCSFLVLDEADRMLDMGFEPQIRKIVSQIRPDRQTLMFTATWPREIRALASDFQTQPIHLTVGSLELSANPNIEQRVEVLSESEKPKALLGLLQGEIDNQKTLIFVQTKMKANQIAFHLTKRGIDANCIHGDKTQDQRNHVLNAFRSGKINVLVATDVAARGLDVNDIKYVINYDYPNDSEDYVHRIGRTARHDKKGTSISYFTDQDAPKARDLISVMKLANQTVPEELRRMAGGGFHGKFDDDEDWGAGRGRQARA